MFEINLDNLSGIAYPEQIKILHNSLTNPFLISLFIIIFLVFLIAGLSIAKGKQSKKTFMSIWVISIIFCLIILTIFIFLPNTFISILNNIINFFIK